MVAAKPFPVSCLTVLALLVQIVALLQQAEPKSYQGVYVAGDIILGKKHSSTSDSGCGTVGRLVTSHTRDPAKIYQSIDQWHRIEKFIIKQKRLG